MPCRTHVAGTVATLYGTAHGTYRTTNGREPHAWGSRLGGALLTGNAEAGPRSSVCLRYLATSVTHASLQHLHTSCDPAYLTLQSEETRARPGCITVVQIDQCTFDLARWHWVLYILIIYTRTQTTACPHGDIASRVGRRQHCCGARQHLRR